MAAVTVAIRLVVKVKGAALVVGAEVGPGLVGSGLVEGVGSGLVEGVGAGLVEGVGTGLVEGVGTGLVEGVGSGLVEGVGGSGSACCCAEQSKIEKQLINSKTLKILKDSIFCLFGLCVFL